MQVPIPCDEGTTEINQFIACHRITSVRQYVVRSDEAPILVFVVEYGEEDKRSQRSNSVKIDYREILTADQFVGFSRLRDKNSSLCSNPFAIHSDFSEFHPPIRALREIRGQEPCQNSFTRNSASPS